MQKSAPQNGMDVVQGMQYMVFFDIKLKKPKSSIFTYGVVS